MNWYLRTALIMIFPALVALYTLNFGRWLEEKNYRRGAVGMYVLAIVTVAVPLMILILLAD